MLQRRIQMRALAGVLSLSFCCGVFAADTVSTTSPARVIELQLGPQGTVVGQVVNRQGAAVANASVVLSGQQGNLATLKTDHRGVFAVKGLQTGQIAMTVNQQIQPVRLWNAQTAPPNSAKHAMLVVGETVRGQCCGANCGGCSACSPVQNACAPSILPSNCGPNCGGCNSCGGGGGCFGGGSGGGILSRPWLLGAGVAAAIAIPLAIDDDDDDAS